MQKQEPNVSENSNGRSAKNQYCECEMMNRKSEVVAEVYRAGEFLLQYHKRERKFLLHEHSAGDVTELNLQHCPWCQCEIADL
jgi:hypothetical protein